MQLLEGIDPNPENYVTAGILHTKTQQVGCLLRLEPNKQAGVSLKYHQIKQLLILIFSFVTDVPINHPIK